MEHAAHAGIGDLFWPALNFAIFAWVLVQYVFGPVREFFRARSERLHEALAAGVRARDEAKALRAQLEKDIAALPTLLEKLRSDLRAAAERERGTLLEQGRHAAERIRSDAEMLAAQEFTSARDALRTEVLEEAVREATRLVRGAVRSEDQERLVHEFVAGAGAAAS